MAASSRGDNRAECQRYLTEFRVTELKELLKLSDQSLRGRKPELFQKANALLIHGSSKVQHQIRSIYSRTHKSRRSPRGAQTHKTSHSQSYPEMKSLMRHHKPKSEYSSTTSVAKEERSYIIHPDVKFKPHAFYLKLESIIRPTALVSSAVTSNGSSSMRIQFHLTPEQVNLICRSRTPQGIFGVQILLRFCRKESSCDQEDFYPKQCYVKVNNSYCTLPGYNPHMSLRPDYKRLGSPVNITNLVKTSASDSNDVVFYWINDILYPQGFCINIDLVQNLSSSDLLQNLKSKGVRSPEVTRALVKEKLAIDRDSEISATSLRVSLLCPLGKLRMTHPCRSQMCTHLQCFDASIYLQMNERKTRWVCPVCDKAAPADSLVIDGLFKEICAEATSNEIGFNSDGSWYSITLKAPTHSLTPERKLLHRDDSSPMVLSDTSEYPNPRGEGSVIDPIVIDLTSDEEEEEENVETNSSSNVNYSSYTSIACCTAITTTLTPSISSSTSSSSSNNSWTPHIINPTPTYQCDEGYVHKDISRSVIVKRRCSSTGLDVDDSCPSTSVSTDTTSGFPVPVITDYAPTLPYFNAPMIPYLSQPTVQTVLASSDNSLHTGVGGGSLNLNDLQHLPSLVFDDNIFTLIQQNRSGNSSITIIED